MMADQLLACTLLCLQPQFTIKQEIVDSYNA